MVSVVVALLAFKVLGVLVGVAWFLVKLAAFAALVFFILRAVRSRGR